MLRVVRKEILVIRFRNVTNNECAIKNHASRMVCTMVM